jgi:ABC-type transporter Mla MlaB component
MIRITTHTEAQTVHLILEGKLTGSCVEVLRKCWEQVLSSPPATVLVNLTDLTSIDSEGKELLAKIHRLGARLIGSGVMVEAIIAEIDPGQDDRNPAGRRPEWVQRNGVSAECRS